MHAIRKILSSSAIKLLIGASEIAGAVIVSATDNPNFPASTLLICGICLIVSGFVGFFLRRVQRDSIDFSKTDSHTTASINAFAAILLIIGIIGAIFSITGAERLLHMDLGYDPDFNTIGGIFITILKQIVHWLLVVCLWLLELIIGICSDPFEKILLSVSIFALVDIFHIVDYNMGCYCLLNGGVASAKKIVWGVLGFAICIFLPIKLTNPLVGMKVNMTAAEVTNKLMQDGQQVSYFTDLRFLQWGTFLALFIPMLIFSHYWKSIILASKGIAKLLLGALSLSAAVGFSIVIANSINTIASVIVGVIVYAVIFGITGVFFSKYTDVNSERIEESVNKAYAVGSTDTHGQYLSGADLQLYKAMHAGEFRDPTVDFVEKEIENRETE